MSIAQAIVYSDVCSLLTREKANVAFNDKACKGFLFKGKQQCMILSTDCFFTLNVVINRDALAIK